MEDPKQISRAGIGSIFRAFQNHTSYSRWMEARVIDPLTPSVDYAHVASCKTSRQEDAPSVKDINDDVMGERANLPSVSGLEISCRPLYQNIVKQILDAV